MLISSYNYTYLGQVIICKERWFGADIMRYDPISNIFENITKIFTSVGGIAFDHIGNNLYISNIANRSIEVYNVKTLAMTAFYFQDIPDSIALVPEERYTVELIILIINEMIINVF